MIKEQFKKAKIELTEEQAEKLALMSDFLMQYNRKVNLTAIKTPQEIAEKHFVDSVLPLTMVEVPEGARCADIGTGAGFPALPMMIYRADLRFTLVDALQKRTVYLQEISSQLALSPEILHRRAEELGQDARYREHYGMVTARAVSDLSTLAEYCLPLLKKGGIFLAMRGSSRELEPHHEEVFKRLGGELKQEIEYSLPCGDGRRLLIIEKVEGTPKKYPRSAAQMKKSPL